MLSEKLMDLIKASNLDPSSDNVVWELKGRGGAPTGKYCLSHAACEVLARDNGIEFRIPEWLYTSDRSCACQVVGDRLVDGEPSLMEVSVGEASPANTTQVSEKYPYSMAEKRAKDRVTLKLLGIHGVVYSESESDDFKEAPQSTVDLDKLRDLYRLVLDMQFDEVLKQVILDKIQEASGATTSSRNTDGSDAVRQQSDDYLP